MYSYELWFSKINYSKFSPSGKSHQNSRAAIIYSRKSKQIDHSRKYKWINWYSQIWNFKLKWIDRGDETINWKNEKVNQESWGK